MSKGTSEGESLQVLCIGLGLDRNVRYQLQCHSLRDAILDLDRAEVFLPLIQAGVDNLLIWGLIPSNSSYPEIRYPFQGFLCHEWKSFCCCRD